jgi:hypothetical protein
VYVFAITLHFFTIEYTFTKKCVLQKILKISALLSHTLCCFQRVLCNFEQSRLIYFTNVISMFCFASSRVWWLFPVFLSALRKRRQMRKVNLDPQTTWRIAVVKRTTVVMAVWAVRLPRDFFIFMKLINVMTILVYNRTCKDVLK